MAIGAIHLTREEITQRVRSGVLATRSDVAAIVIFGSFARSDNYRHDITAAEKGLAVAQRSLNTARTFVEWWFTPPDTNSMERSQ